MEGGVAFFLLLILLVVAVGFGIVLYATGGALLGKSDRDAGGDDEPRPVHKHPTSPTEEKVRLAGTGGDEGKRSST